MISSLLVISPATYFQAAYGQDTNTRSMQNVTEASAYWAIKDSEGIPVEEIFLTVIKSQDGIDVFVTKTTEDFSLLSGHTFLDDNSLFSAGNKLDSAVLLPVSVNICSPSGDDQDENGDCTEVTETLQIQAEWSATTEKAAAIGKGTDIIDVNKSIQFFSASYRFAVSTGAVNGEQLGESEFALIMKAKGLEINVETSRKTVNFGALGNKGTLAANAIWSDATVDGESALVFLRVSTQAAPSGDLTRVSLDIVFQESGLSLTGQLEIPDDAENGKNDDGPFMIDNDLDTATLEPVTVTVCAFEIEVDCSDPSAEGRAEYTIQAAWDGTDGSIIMSRSFDYFRMGDFQDRSSDVGVVVLGEATGSIDGQNLGDADRGDLFHLT